MNPYLSLQFSNERGTIPKDQTKTIKVTFMCLGLPSKGNLLEMF